MLKSDIKLIAVLMLVILNSLFICVLNDKHIDSFDRIFNWYLLQSVGFEAHYVSRTYQTMAIGFIACLSQVRLLEIN